MGEKRGGRRYETEDTPENNLEEIRWLPFYNFILNN